MENDQKFQGGGTPIGSIIQEQIPPQHQQQMPPQHQQQMVQEQMPPQHQQQMIQQQQMAQQQMIQQQMAQQQQRRPPPQQQQRRLPNNDKQITPFEETMGMSILQFIILIILISVINSPFVIGIEKKMLPVNFRMGDPPFVIIIFNAILITLIYIGINKLQDKLKN